MSTAASKLDPTVGKILPDLDFEVTERLLRDYHGGLAIERRKGDKVPTMVAGAADDFHEHSRYRQDRGHLWMRQEWDIRAPLEIETTYVAHACIEDIYQRRDRTVVNTAMTLVGPTGEVVLTSKHHQSFLLGEPVEQVRFRDPSKKEGARAFTVPEGDPIEPLDVTISLEMCGQYFHGNRSYHTDLDASRELGFNDVVVGGRMTMSYVGHVLERHFGDPWWTSGRLDLKFTNPVWPDDRLQVRAVDTGSSADDPRRRRAFAWMEKDDGTVAVVANASCLPD